MSVYSLMRTGASGMNAQGSRLATVADNIANAKTTGYKRSSTEFAALVLAGNNTSGQYSSGGVESYTRYSVSQQGILEFSTSNLDLAINGDGFFLVQGGSDDTALTRAGSFVLDSDGNLVNAAGYSLLGYPIDTDGNTVVANGTAGLEVVSIGGQALQASPSTTAEMSFNLPSNATVVAAANLPSANAVTAEYTSKTSIVGYDSLGNERVLDIYFSKTAAEQWEVTVYSAEDAAPGGTFPYTAAALATDTLLFDASSGDLTGASASSLTIPVPAGENLAFDMSDATQLAAEYTVLNIAVNGNGPAEAAALEITDDGFVMAIYDNGTRVPTFRIPLGSVLSPDRLTPQAGTTYTLSSDSGDLLVGLPASGGLGSVVSGALEASTVDLATELTTMIESQRNYTANSKVFQTGSDLLDVVVNLKR